MSEHWLTHAWTKTNSDAGPVADNEMPRSSELRRGQVEAGEEIPSLADLVGGLF